MLLRIKYSVHLLKYALSFFFECLLSENFILLHILALLANLLV